MKKLAVLLFLQFSTIAIGQTSNYYDVIGRAYDLLMNRPMVSYHPRNMVFRSYFVDPSTPASLFQADLVLKNGVWEGVDFKFFQDGYGTKVNIVVGMDRLGTFDAKISSSGNLLVTATKQSRVIEYFKCGFVHHKTVCDLKRFDDFIVYREQ